MTSCPSNFNFANLEISRICSQMHLLGSRVTRTANLATQLHPYHTFLQPGLATGIQLPSFSQLEVYQA